MNDDQQMRAMDAIDAMGLFVATVIGAKQQLINSGWSDEAAERLVIFAVTREPDRAKGEA